MQRHLAGFALAAALCAAACSSQESARPDPAPAARENAAAEPAQAAAAGPGADSGADFAAEPGAESGADLTAAPAAPSRPEPGPPREPARPRAAAPESPAAETAPAEAAPAARRDAPGAGAAKSVDLEQLTAHLKATPAIGVFTKLELKNQIDALVKKARASHERGDPPLALLRERFEGLVLKLLSLLQDDAPELAAEVVASRDELWALLSDPVRLSRL